VNPDRPIHYDRLVNSFDARLAESGLVLRRAKPRVLQLNLGRKCDLTCNHCHVSAGPGREETMSEHVAARCLAWMERHRPEIVDLTGGAPELCAQFRRLAAGARRTGATVLVRTNLTVLFEPGQEDLGSFFRANRIHVIASMPCYLPENVDAQRGPGVFERSIRGLKHLNSLGYGRDSALPLDLMYNPGGAALPPDQSALERDYRRVLGERDGVVFNRLLTLANVPIGRFDSWLHGAGSAAGYQKLLRDGFNAATVPRLMCRDTVSVGWEGDLFDCDFNQQLDLPMGANGRRFLWDLEPAGLAGLPIATGDHCFGCTAGHGSSCGGALV
jgi:radical SAM/Cys-rich protein